MHNKWAGSNTELNKVPGSLIINSIPKGLWQIVTTMSGRYIQKIADTFELPEKIYNVEEEFINKVLKSYNALNSSIGVLLTGLKGTGKTITAKQLALQCDLPIIVVNAQSIDALEFLTDVEQPLCIFIDEFEKVVNVSKDGDKDSALETFLLGFLDGTLSNAKHLFILTSNSMQINDFFIDRPGRIRYIKKFNNMDMNLISLVIQDKLKYPEFKNDLINWIKNFKNITLDILISIIDEINIHRCSPYMFKDVFNADNEKSEFSIDLKLHNLSRPNIKPLTLKSRDRHKNTSIQEILAKAFENETLSYSFDVEDVKMGIYDYDKKEVITIPKREEVFRDFNTTEINCKVYPVEGRIDQSILDKIDNECVLIDNIHGMLWEGPLKNMAALRETLETHFGKGKKFDADVHMKHVVMIDDKNELFAMKNDQILIEFIPKYHTPYDVNTAF